MRHVANVLALCSVTRYVAGDAPGHFTEPCEGLVRMQNMDGVIKYPEWKNVSVSPEVERSQRICTWIIDPGVSLEYIQIITPNLSPDSVLHDDGDLIEISGKDGKLLAKFGKDEKIPWFIKFQSDIVTLRLRSSSSATRFSFQYKCIIANDVTHSCDKKSKDFSPERCVDDRVPPAALAMVLFAPLALFFLCMGCVRLCRWNMKRGNCKVLQQRAKRKGVLGLPTHSWRDAKLQHTCGDEECSLCLDPFQDDDSLVILPCKHYFHRMCISRWFVELGSQGQPRTCPKCRRDPLEGREPSAGGCAVCPVALKERNEILQDLRNILQERGEINPSVWGNAGSLRHVVTEPDPVPSIVTNTHNPSNLVPATSQQPSASSPQPTVSGPAASSQGEVQLTVN